MSLQYMSVQQRASAFLVSLLSGNYYGRGSVRKEELHRSAAVLGIPSGHTQVVDDDRLPDDPAIKWGHEVVLSHVFKAIAGHGIQTVSGKLLTMSFENLPLRWWSTSTFPGRMLLHVCVCGGWLCVKQVSGKVGGQARPRPD